MILYYAAAFVVVCIFLFGLVSLILWLIKKFARPKGDEADRNGSAPTCMEEDGENAEAGAREAPQRLSGAAPDGIVPAGIIHAPVATPRRMAKHAHASVREFFMDNIFGRGLIIAAITLGLLIPLAFVSDVVDERSALRRMAVKDIASLWGESQTISGPALVIPYKREYEVRESVPDEGDKKKIVVRKAYAQEYRVILPKQMEFDAVLYPQVRHRGIYEYVVYTSPVAVKGQFRLPTAESFGEDAAEIHWGKAWFSIGITDLKAITKVEPLIWNGQNAPPYSPGGDIGELLGPGFHTAVALQAKDAGTEHAFSLAVNLNGSGGLHFTTVGETTTINISGDWPHPSFTGSLLPASRKIDDTSFSAEWHIPHLSRTYAQSGVLGHGDFSGKSNAIRSFTAGVNLFETVSLYSQVNRSVKYGLLFIGLTFVALLSFELVSRAKLHLMQYALVGIAMTLFYLVLLSLAEHTSFLTAFLAASFISIAMNGLYITAAMRSKKKGLVVTVCLRRSIFCCTLCCKWKNTLCLWALLWS